MTLSIVTTLFKSSIFLDVFISDLVHTLSELNIEEYEIIFVNDGCPEKSLEKAIDLRNSHQNIVIVDLSRNFGHHYAIQAGLAQANGEYIFLIDCDLETSPKELANFWKEINIKNADVVYGYQDTRKGGFAEKYLGLFFWWLFNKMSSIKVPTNITTERLMKRNYLDSLLTLQDKNLFLAGMMHWTGFTQIGLTVARKQRDGKSTYSMTKRIQLMLNAILSFTDYPLMLLFKTGIMITILSFITGTYLITRKLLWPQQYALGWSSLLVTILFSTGSITASIGVIGIYIGKIFKQVQGRPNYIIKKIYK